MSQDKRVCIVNTKVIPPQEEGDEAIGVGDRIMRTSRSLADRLINDTKDEEGKSAWAYTSKSKLKSYLNKNLKLTKNMNHLQMLIDLGMDSNRLKEQRTFDGKTIVIAPTVKQLRYDDAMSVEVPAPITINHSRWDRKSGVTKDFKQTVTTTGGTRFNQTIRPTTKFIRVKPSVNTMKKRKEEASKETRIVMSGQRRLIVAYPAR